MGRPTAVACLVVLTCARPGRADPVTLDVNAEVTSRCPYHTATAALCLESEHDRGERLYAVFVKLSTGKRKRVLVAEWSDTAKAMVAHAKHLAAVDRRLAREGFAPTTEVWRLTVDDGPAPRFTLDDDVTIGADAAGAAVTLERGGKVIRRRKLDANLTTEVDVFRVGRGAVLVRVYESWSDDAGTVDITYRRWSYR